MHNSWKPTINAGVGWIYRWMDGWMDRWLSINGCSEYNRGKTNTTSTFLATQNTHFGMVDISRDNSKYLDD